MVVLVWRVLRDDVNSLAPICLAAFYFPLVSNLNENMAEGLWVHVIRHTYYGTLSGAQISGPRHRWSRSALPACLR